MRLLSLIVPYGQVMSEAMAHALRDDQPRSKIKGKPMPPWKPFQFTSNRDDDDDDDDYRLPSVEVINRINYNRGQRVKEVPDQYPETD